MKCDIYRGNSDGVEECDLERGHAGTHSCYPIASPGARPPAALRAIAEDIVRNHEYNCEGTYIADAWHCSAAPIGHPLCPACSKLADAIEAALASGEAPQEPPVEDGFVKDITDIVERLEFPFGLGYDGNVARDLRDALNRFKATRSPAPAPDQR